MNLEQLGVVVCRGVGLLLLLAGLCALFPAVLVLLFGPTTELLNGARVSWTQYAPPQFTFGQFCLVALRSNSGHIVQGVLGVGLLVFSRYVGSLLTTGLLGRAT